MASLPPKIRRIVTGHTPEGDAIVDSDTQLTPYNPFTPECLPATVEDLGFTTIFRTASFPATPDGPWTDINGAPTPICHPVGTTVRMVDFPPSKGAQGLMHRTISVDFGIMLKGEVELELDNGVTINMKEHDVVVQRGTIHSWNNKGSEPVRMLFVLVPAKPVKVGEKELEATPLPAELTGGDV